MPDAKFRIGIYWLDQVEGSQKWYRFWYDARARKTRRRSLGVSDFERAKIELAAIVIEQGGSTDSNAGSNEPRHPKDVLLIASFNHYWTNYSDKRRNPRNARRPGELLLEYFGTVSDKPPRVADLKKSRQEGFMRYLGGREFAVSSISRHLSIIKSALNYGAAEQLIVRDGDELEIQLLEFAPKVYDAAALVSRITDRPEPEPSNWTPSVDQVAAFMEDIRSDHLFRYCILALNTWARPEAICESGPWGLDREHGLLRLNPIDRRQTKKVRPSIRLTENLSGWIEHWASEDAQRPETWPEPTTWVHLRGKSVKDIKKGFYAHRDRLSLAGERTQPVDWTRYAFRHLMTTVTRRAEVPKDQQDMWLGHVNKQHKSTDWYGAYEPGFLKGAADSTDEFIKTIDQAIVKRAKAQGRIPKRRLIAPKVHPSLAAATRRVL